MTTKTIQDLIENTDYAVQVRAKTADSISEWSPALNFTTITDDSIPAVPANVTWSILSDAFVGTWDSVGLDTNGKYTKVERYEVQLTANSITKIVSVPQITDSAITFVLSAAQNKTLFGTIQSSIGMRVRSVNSTGAKSNFSTLITATALAPSAPTNVIVTGIVDGMTISWDASVGAVIDHYNVYVSLSSSFTTSILNRIYSGPELNTTYSTSTYFTHYFKVTAVDMFGRESAAATASGEPISPFGPDTTPPGAVSGLSAIINTATKTITASWTASTEDDLGGYVLRWRKTGNTNWGMEYISKDLTTITFNIPQGFVSYDLQIAALDNVANYSTWSATVTVSGDVPGAPPQVTGVTLVPGVDALKISWNASAAADVANGAGTYEVQYDTTGSFSAPTSIITGATNINLVALNRTTTYYVRVRAIDAGGSQGTFSTTASATTLAFPVPPTSDGSPPASSPTPVLKGGTGYIVANWPAITNNDAVTYEVHISTTTGFTPSTSTKVATVGGTNATIVYANSTGTILSYGTTYYVKIVAKDVDGAAAAGTQASASMVQATNTDLNIDTRALGVPKVFLQTTQPATGMITNDQWYDTDDNNKEYVYNGTAWVSVRDATIATAQSTADGKNKVYYQTTQPTGGVYQTNDIWYDTDDGYHMYVYNGTAWVDSQLGTGAISNLAITNAKISSLDGGKITADTIDANALKANSIFSKTIILGTAGTPGVFQSYDYVASTTGFKISSGGIDIAQGSINAATLKSGTISATTITLSSTGILKSADYNGSTTGWSLTSGGLDIKTGSVSASTMSAGTITATGITLNGDLNIASSGYIQSANYTTGGTVGFRLTSTGLDVKSGTVSAGTLIAGTITSSGISVGAGGVITVSSTGAVQSSNYASNSTGWKLSSSGLELNSGTVKASAITTGTISGNTITLSGTGTITGPGFTLSGSGLSVSSGTITSASISTNSLTSLSTDPVTGLPLFSINAGGYATLAGAKILGNTILGSASSTTHYLQSYNYSPGAIGWKIDAAGNAFMNTLSATGTIITQAGTRKVTMSPSAGILVESDDGNLQINPNAGNTGIGSTAGIKINFTGSPYTSYIQNWAGGGLAINNGSLRITLDSGNIWGGGAGLIFDGTSYFNNPIHVDTVWANEVRGVGTVFSPNTTLILSPSGGELQVLGSSNWKAKLRGYTGGASIIIANIASSGGPDNEAVFIGGPDAGDNAPTSNSTRAIWCYRVNAFAAYNNVSDERDKSNIKPLTGAIDIIKQVNINEFEYNINRGVKDYGVIAQDIVNVLPDLVTVPEDKERSMMMAYNGLFSITTAATKELIEENESLKTRMNDLEEKVKELLRK